MSVHRHKSMDPRQIYLLLLMLLFSCLLGGLQAYQFNVGGRQGWVVNPSEDYNRWSGRMRFQVNDTLLFKYNKGADSVLEVSKDDYDKCNTQNPIKKMEDGNSVFNLDRSGPFYFISGNKDNCNKGQKLTVVVMHVRNKPKPSPPPPPVAPAPTPSPPPAPGTTPVSPTPAVSPAPGATPSSPPAPGTTPSSPPAPGATPPPGSGPVAPSTPTVPTPSTSPPGSSPANINSTAPPPPRSSAPAFMTPAVAFISSVSLVVGAFLG